QTERQLWEKCSPCHSDLCVCGGNKTLCRSDIGPALEKLRWKRHGNFWRLQRKVFSRDAELSGRFADQNCDRMFELRTRYTDIDSLRACCFELSFGLGNVQLRRNPVAMPVHRELKRLFVRGNAHLKKPELLIKPAQLHVVGSEFSLHAEPNVLQISANG